MREVPAGLQEDRIREYQTLLSETFMRPFAKAKPCVVVPNLATPVRWPQSWGVESFRKKAYLQWNREKQQVEKT